MARGGRATVQARWAALQAVAAQQHAGGDDDEAGGGGGEEEHEEENDEEDEDEEGEESDGEDGAAADHGAASASNVSMRSRGEHGRPDQLPATPELNRGSRARSPPNRYTAEEKRERKKERQRKLTVEERIEEHVPDGAFIGDAHTTARNIANATLSRCCKANLMPIAPAQTIGSHAMVFLFECEGCGETTRVPTGGKARLLLEPTGDEEEDARREEEEELDDEEDDDGTTRRKRRKQKARTQTNSRPRETMNLLVSTLLIGIGYQGYKDLCMAQQLKPVSNKTYDRMLTYVMPKIEKLAQETVQLVRYLIVRYGDYMDGSIEHMIFTHDFFWLTRGHFSHNGTGTICDLHSAGVIAYRHYTQRDDKLSDAPTYDGTSKSMDAKSLESMLEEAIEWIEECVPKLLEELGDDTVPSLDGVVLDGDASTNPIVRARHEAIERKAAEAQKTNYCNNMHPIPCCNHLAKNAGKAAYEIGHRLHRTCSCSIKQTLDGEDYKSGQREHRGLNEESDAQVKAWQRSVGAALRSARARGSEPANAGKALRDVAIEGLEETFNHLRNVHSGPGVWTDEQRACRLHEPTKADGTSWVSSAWNDCPDFHREMAKWLKANVVDPIDDIVHPQQGAVSQNASERVGRVALKFRTKDVDLLKTHYVASTSLAIAHVNNIVIRNFRRAIARNGCVDDRIEAFGTFQQRLFELMKLPTTEAQRQAWDLAAEQQSKKSEKRKSRLGMSQRRQQRKAATEFRQSLRSCGHTYKGDGGGGGGNSSSGCGSGKGVVGACTCTATCQRGCPCRIAKEACTGSCHPRSHACKNLPGGAADTSSDDSFDDAMPLRELPELDAELEGQLVRFHYDGYGWLEGEISEYRGAVDRSSDGGGGEDGSQEVAFHVQCSPFPGKKWYIPLFD